MDAFYVILGIAAYFLPTIVAVVRRAKANVTQVVIVNVLLGWTFVGWIVALVMSTSNTGHLASHTVNVSVNQSNDREGPNLP